MEPTRGLGAFRTVFHLPRTVRLRLAVLYGLVVLVSGGALLAITFAFGSFKSTKNLFGGGCALVTDHTPPCVINFAVAGGFPRSGQAGSMTIVKGAGVGSRSVTVAQVEHVSA
jgi:hypothetical protein